MLSTNNKGLLLILETTIVVFASFHQKHTTSSFAPILPTPTTPRRLQRLSPNPSPMSESTLRQRNRSQNTQQPATANVTTKNQGASKSSSQLSASVFGIDEWSTISQVGVFVSIYIALGISTYVTTNILDIISKNGIGLESWRTNYIDTSLPLILGFFYGFAGVGHFTNSNAFCDIYPPLGTWGFWYLPGSASFHVTWTGIIELLGGLGLFGSGLNNLLPFGKDDLELPLSLIQPVSALMLFVLTILVTPANIYMFTHGAVMGDAMAPLGVSFHIIRFGFQVLFLSLLYTLSKDSFFYAWGDELD